MESSQIVLKLVLDEIGLQPQVSTFPERLSIQKTIYLTQLTGLDLGYRFSWYIHGPYCRELTSDAFQLVEALESNESVPGDRPLNPLAREFAGKARTIWENQPSHIASSEWLELLASLHYLKHIVYWPGAQRPREFDVVFAALVKSKPRFEGNRAETLLAWDRLGQVGLLDHKVMARP
ncbi:MAG: hypothetical protein ACHRXM_37405 [Isosphaerales bacterium]